MDATLSRQPPPDKPDKEGQSSLRDKALSDVFELKDAANDSDTEKLKNLLTKLKGDLVRWRNDMNRDITAFKEESRRFREMLDRDVIEFQSSLQNHRVPFKEFPSQANTVEYRE